LLQILLDHDHVADLSRCVGRQSGRLRPGRVRSRTAKTRVRKSCTTYEP